MTPRVGFTMRIVLSALALVAGGGVLAGPSAGTAAPTSPSAESPPPRTYPGLATDPAAGQVVLFGGEKGLPLETFGDTWTWDGAAWTERHPTTPPPRMGTPTMAYDAARRVVVLFGADDGGATSTWIWDGVEWTQQYPAASPPGGFNQMAFDPATRTMLMHTMDGDQWTWDGAEWRAHPHHPGPNGQILWPAVSTSGGSIVFFGGARCDEVCGGGADMWLWNGVWNHVHPASRPSPRSGAGMAPFDARSVVLFGGASTFDRLGDTWAWNGATWQRRRPTSSPSARDSMGLAYDPVSRHALLFGGESLDGPMGDTWSYDGTTWTCLDGC